jgi:hypothetical protein
MISVNELFGDQETILSVGHDERTAEQGRIRNSADRVLERRIRAEQRQKLLGRALARGRPEPRAGTAAHDQRDDWFSHENTCSDCENLIEPAAFPSVPL